MGSFGKIALSPPILTTKNTKKRKDGNRRFRRFSQIFKRKERLTQGSQEKQTLAGCFCQHNLLLNKELRRCHKKTSPKKQGNTKLYYEQH